MTKSLLGTTPEQIRHAKNQRTKSRNAWRRAMLSDKRTYLGKRRDVMRLVGYNG